MTDPPGSVQKFVQKKEKANQEKNFFNELKSCRCLFEKMKKSTHEKPCECGLREREKERERERETSEKMNIQFEFQRFISCVVSRDVAKR